MAVPREHDAIGEAQATGDHLDRGATACRCRRIVDQHASRRAVLEDVEHAGLKSTAPVTRREPPRRISEVDLAVHRHGHGIGIANRLTGHRIGEYPQLPRSVYRQQATDRIGRIQRTGGIEIEAQHAPSGLDEHLAIAAIRRHAQHAPRLDRDIELAVRTERDMLRSRRAAELDALQVSESAVDRMHAGIAWR